MAFLDINGVSKREAIAFLPDVAVALHHHVGALCIQHDLLRLALALQQKENDAATVSFLKFSYD
jgi:hypothetical protein